MSKKKHLRAEIQNLRREKEYWRRQTLYACTTERDLRAENRELRAANDTLREQRNEAYAEPDPETPERDAYGFTTEQEAVAANPHAFQAPLYDFFLEMCKLFAMKPEGCASVAQEIRLRAEDQQADVTRFGREFDRQTDLLKEAEENLRQALDTSAVGYQQRDELRERVNTTITYLLERRNFGYVGVQDIIDLLSPEVVVTVPPPSADERRFAELTELIRDGKATQNIEARLVFDHGDGVGWRYADVTELHALRLEYDTLKARLEKEWEALCD